MIMVKGGNGVYVQRYNGLFKSRGGRERGVEERRILWITGGVLVRRMSREEFLVL